MNSKTTMLVGTILALGLAGTAAAQIRPLPPRPTGPTLSAPTIAPLQIVEAPTGEIFASYIFGAAANRPDPLMVRTRGGRGTVTLTVEAEGRPRGATLVDPVQSAVAQNMQLAPNMRTTMRSVDSEASPVSKVIVVQGYGEVTRSVPGTHMVTVIARDSGGAEVRKSFRVRYTRAMGPPTAPSPNPSTSQVASSVPSHFTPAQAEMLYDPDVPIVSHNRVQLSSAGYSMNISFYDPATEVICVYGSFRYLCEYSVDQEARREELIQRMTVKVPDIGRGNTVGIILKNPYGESAPVVIQIDSKRTVQLRRSRGFNGPAAGVQTGAAAPFYSDSPIGNNASNRACDLPYLIWVDAKTDGRMFHDPKGPPITLKFSGNPTVRVKSVPRGQPITNNVATSWAQLEYDIPAGLVQDYLYTMELSYFTRVGECPAKRR